MQGMINDPKAALKFLLAGNATATFRSLKSGKHFTYQIEAAPHRDGYPDACFVGILAGPDNTQDYRYAGMLNRIRGFWLTSKSKFGFESLSIIAIQDTMEELIKGKIPYMVEIWHEGLCGRCGRPLTVPKSISDSLINGGLGPECAKLV